MYVKLPFVEVIQALHDLAHLAIGVFEQTVFLVFDCVLVRGFMGKGHLLNEQFPVRYFLTILLKPAHVLVLEPFEGAETGLEDVDA